MVGKRDAVLAACFFFLALPLAAHPGEISLDLGAGRISRSVLSFHEIRQGKTIRQRWDRSCGSAALSTILTHHYGDKVSEALVIVSILRISDPAKVRARGGFSLFELKRYVESRGYEGRGYGGMTLQELAGLGAPAIVPTKVRGYDHFVVFRGVREDRVLVSDPAFGSLTMKIDDFLHVWQGGIGFVVLRKGYPPSQEGLSPMPEEFLMPDGGAIMRTNLSIAPSPSTRRIP